MRQSRKLLCTKAIYSHFNQYSVNYELSLISNTINKYFYKLIIPIEFYMEKVRFNSTGNLLNLTEDLNVNWEKEIIVQKLPDIQVIKDNFHNHFTFYEKKSKNKENPHTYMKIQNISQDDNISITIEVSYYKHFRPFPNCNDTNNLIKTNEYLFDKVNGLQENLKEIHHETDMAMLHLNSRIKRLRKQVTYSKIHSIEKQRYYDTLIEKYKEKYQMQENNYQKIIRQYYQELHKTDKENCPVCYEELNGETMFIPNCVHFICSNCASKCKNMCPLCRAELNITENQFQSEISEEMIDHMIGLN